MTACRCRTDEQSNHIIVIHRSDRQIQPLLLHERWRDFAVADPDNPQGALSVAPPVAS